MKFSLKSILLPHGHPDFRSGFESIIEKLREKIDADPATAVKEGVKKKFEGFGP